MFKGLRDKLKQAVNLFSKKVEEEAEEILEPETSEQELTTDEKSAEIADDLSEETVEESVEVLEEPTLEESPEILEEEPEIKESAKAIEEDQAVEQPVPISKKEQPVSEEQSEESDKQPEIQWEESDEQPIPSIEQEQLEASESTSNDTHIDQELTSEGSIKEKAIEEAELTKSNPIEKPKGFFGRLGFKKKVEETKPKGKKSLFSQVTDRLSKKILSEEQYEELFWDLEIILLENNVALGVIEKIKSDLAQELVGKPLNRGKLLDIIQTTLSKSITELFDVDQIDLLQKSNEKKPLIICFVGINGSGKTTTIAKIAHLFRKNKKSVVMAAGDTFRAAAIDQLAEHAHRLGVRLIKHDYGSDPAAVAFDAIQYAKANNKDVVLIDTAGRLHSNKNLMDELKKVQRVNNPDIVLFVGESITGNDCVEQAQEYDNAIGIDGIILTKADVDEKGGAAVSVSYVTKKPILFFGTGQEYDDLTPFDPEIVIKGLGLE